MFAKLHLWVRVPRVEDGNTFAILQGLRLTECPERWGYLREELHIFLEYRVSGLVESGALGGGFSLEAFFRSRPERARAAKPSGENFPAKEKTL